MDGPLRADFFAARLLGLVRSAVGFCVGRRLPIRSLLPYESALRRPDNLARWANQARCCRDIALLGVTTKPKYVNIADIMADISLTTPGKSRSAAAAVESVAEAREPCWDLIELLFFAYRDFVGDPDQVLERLGFGRAHHRVLHFVNRNPGMKVAELLDVLKITKQSLGRVLKQLIDEGYVVQKEGADDRRQRLLYVSPAGEALAQKLAALQTARIGRVLDELGPGARETARRFLAGMIDADDRDRVLRLITRTDRVQSNGRD
jgi:DNA-binding MarR family transcriptional regulator